TKLIAQFEKDRVKLERLMIPELMREFRALGAHVANAAEGQGGLLWEASRAERTRIRRILEAATLGKWAKDHLQPLFEKHWRRVLDSTVATLKGLDIPVTLRNELAQELLDMGGKRIGLLDLDADTKSALFRVLEEGREQG